MSNMLLTKCSGCSGTAIGAFVQYGSYFTRCLACGENGPATSWIAIAETMTEHIRAVVVEANQNEIELLGEGRANELAGLIAKAAQQGKLVRLAPPGGND